MESQKAWSIPKAKRGDKINEGPSPAQYNTV